jgi:hypothetical protein
MPKKFIYYFYRKRVLLAVFAICNRGTKSFKLFRNAAWPVIFLRTESKYENCVVVRTSSLKYRWETLIQWSTRVAFRALTDFCCIFFGWFIWLVGLLSIGLVYFAYLIFQQHWLSGHIVRAIWKTIMDLDLSLF